MKWRDPPEGRRGSAGRCHGLHDAIATLRVAVGVAVLYIGPGDFLASTNFACGRRDEGSRSNATTRRGECASLGRALALSSLAREASEQKKKESSPSTERLIENDLTWENGHARAYTPGRELAWAWDRIRSRARISAGLGRCHHRQQNDSFWQL